MPETAFRRPFPPKPLAWPLTEEAMMRFWASVRKGSPDECWEWQRTRTKATYGRFTFQGKHYPAHRVAFALTVGADPGPDQIICHSCDNPPCCNPAHLWAGTHTENALDKCKKERNPAGTRCRNAVLTPELVALILKDTRPQTVVAAALGVSRQTISYVQRGVGWKRVGLVAPDRAATTKRNSDIGRLHGEASPNAKLTSEQARAIFNDPRPPQDVAEIYGISETTVRQIRNGQRWHRTLQGKG